MILPKLLSLLLILMVLKESSAVRGALFRSGRSVPFERAPGQQDFLRFGRASGAERVGEPQDEIKYGSYGGDADILY
ncbi:hypothetical protein L3Y34_002698 [Caenorhabditis briggsae]|uniref:Uncharacterized protein n=1 Tax=Caenorhabditis briggsae TaxID=6238 RepID=A0AAE9DGC9_CAEBR|nr:hypothetical protein L3Y34_002698 [Caenorhabditis briggsae]